MTVPLVPVEDGERLPPGPDPVAGDGVRYLVSLLPRHMWEERGKGRGETWNICGEDVRVCEETGEGEPLAEDTT